MIVRTFDNFFIIFSGVEMIMMFVLLSGLTCQGVMRCCQIISAAFVYPNTAIVLLTKPAVHQEILPW